MALRDRSSGHHCLPVARRTSSRNSASAALQRRSYSSGVMSGTSPSLPRRCGLFALTMVLGLSDATASAATCRWVGLLLAVTIAGPAIAAAWAFFLGARFGRWV
jgi:hypothetical protein